MHHKGHEDEEERVGAQWEQFRPTSTLICMENPPCAEHILAYYVWLLTILIKFMSSLPQSKSMCIFSFINFIFILIIWLLRGVIWVWTCLLETPKGISWKSKERVIQPDL